MKVSIGDVFGEWTVIDFALNRKFGTQSAKYWKCQCSCGVIREVYQGSLLGGKSLSCGHVGKEAFIKRNVGNKYGKKPDNRREQFDGYIKIFNDAGDFFVVDNEDATKFDGHRCYAKDGRWFVLDDGVVLSVQNFILRLPSNSIVDHKDRNPSNNRRCNLRECTQQENFFNKSLNKRNKTGVSGVQVEHRNEKIYYSVTLGKGGKSVYRNHFKNFDDAVKARLEAEAEYFGEFAPQRDLFEKYGVRTE